MTGLLDAGGAEIASYTYDAWGNVIADTEKSFCYEGYEVPFELNHVLYRGYYYDGSCTDTESDTNLYYLQSRYYDAEVGRFINADDVKYLDVSESEVSKDNLYVYCNSNPINNIDSEGNLIILIRVRVYWKKSYKQRKNEYFTKVLSGWYKTDDFESITLNTGYSISASVSSELGVSAEVVTAKVGLGSSCTISSTASGTHKIKKKKGKYVRFVGKMDANVWDIKITTTYYCYFVKMKSKTKKGKLYVPIRNTLSIGVEYSNKKY